MFHRIVEAAMLQLSLDPALQLWVLFPITLATLLMVQLRRNLTALLSREPPLTPVKVSNASQLARAALLRQNFGYLSCPQFEARRLFFVRDDGPLDKPQEQVEQSPLAALLNPHALANQAATVVLSVVPQTLLGQWASIVFQGLIICRLPFTLSPRFRSMLQGGVEHAVQNLDVSYVSSLSWYILNLFGNSALVSLFSVPESVDALIPNLGPQSTVSLQPGKIYNTERTALASINYRSELADQIEIFLATDPTDFALRTVS